MSSYCPVQPTVSSAASLREVCVRELGFENSGTDAVAAELDGFLIEVRPGGGAEGATVSVSWPSTGLLGGFQLSREPAASDLLGPEVVVRGDQALILALLDPDCRRDLVYAVRNLV